MILDLCELMLWCLQPFSLMISQVARTLGCTCESTQHLLLLHGHATIREAVVSDNALCNDAGAPEQAASQEALLRAAAAAPLLGRGRHCCSQRGQHGSCFCRPGIPGRFCHERWPEDCKRRWHKERGPCTQLCTRSRHGGEHQWFQGRTAKFGPLIWPVRLT